MVIVSHDREFLDQLCTKIVETEHGLATTYKGVVGDEMQLDDCFGRHGCLAGDTLSVRKCEDCSSSRITVYSALFQKSAFYGAVPIWCDFLEAQCVHSQVTTASTWRQRLRQSRGSGPHTRSSRRRSRVRYVSARTVSSPIMHAGGAWARAPFLHEGAVWVRAPFVSGVVR